MGKLADYCRKNPDGFDVSLDWIICSPGKFEGEPLYVPYYYGIGMEGFADESGILKDGTAWDAFYISEEEERDCAQYFDGSTTSKEDTIILYYSDSGFVSSDLCTRKHFEEWSSDPDCQDFGEEDPDAI